MAKRKKYKLKRTTRTYSPIIAVLGGKHHTEYIPLATEVRMLGTNGEAARFVSNSMARKKGIFRRTTY